MCVCHECVKQTCIYAGFCMRLSTINVNFELKVCSKAPLTGLKVACAMQATCERLGQDDVEKWAFSLLYEIARVVTGSAAPPPSASSAPPAALSRQEVEAAVSSLCSLALQLSHQAGGEVRVK